MKSFFVPLLLYCCLSGFSQQNTDSLNFTWTVLDSDSIIRIVFDATRKKPDIKLSVDQSIRFLQERYQPQYWNNNRDPFRRALGQLVHEASYPPYDSAEYFLSRYPFDSINIPWDKFYIWEPLHLKIPYIVPAVAPLPVDSLTEADSAKIRVIADSIGPSHLKLTRNDPGKRPVAGLKDTTLLVIIDTLHEVNSTYKDFPFKYYTYPYQSDSIQVAVRSLLKYVEDRDSSIVRFTGVGDVVTPVWLNSKSDMMRRYWLKNELNDSVTVWIGTPSRKTIGLYLEKGVSFRRPMKQSNINDAKVNVKSQDRSKLLEVQRIITKPQYWIYRAEASCLLNQASLTNWVKGGESSVSMALDITGFADYNNKRLKLSSNNFARLKFGYIASGDYSPRKNLDLLETNSKFNRKAIGKFDFSSIMLFKTQIANGYTYSKLKSGKDTAVLVSSIMNPAILTIGLGLDYKPNKTTSINFSPLSYKGTFVPDTAKIDQTKYGIAKDRRSLNEPGASLLITNEYKPFKNISITNRLQLFTNYIENPQNIDIDWELIGVATINWFTDVRFNFHLIYDDNTKTAKLDSENKPELGPDGKPKKTSRIQFKEMIGFSFAFRF
jgi:hypothetical protein